MKLRPLTLRQAGEFIGHHHRHHQPPKGWKFGVGIEVEGQLVGVAVAARPVARLLDDGRTVEVTRNCTDGTKNVASKLYGTIARAARCLGFEKVITYTLAEESGVSLRAAGWRPVATTRGDSWDRPGRRRVDHAPTCPKVRWEAP